MDPADRDELLDTAEQSLARLGRLVADLLDLSRLRAGALAVQREPVWLDEVIPPALDELGEPGRAVELRIGADLPAAQADPALLTRVMVNVVGNALRYAPPEQPPIVTASSGADLVEVRIVDRGPGLPPEDVERVFVPFQRLGDTDNRAGLGLGLALSRGLVEAMGGTLRPEETPGGGLTMVISLEAAGSDDSADRAEPGRRERQEGHETGPRRRRRAADPPRPSDQPAGTWLRRRVAATGADALRLAGGHPPDLVILDLGLPDLDGVEVIHGLRGWSDVPIIVLSGRTGGADKVAALDAGADDYVTKPFGMEELLARMRAVNRRIGARRPGRHPQVTLGGVTVDLADRPSPAADARRRARST